MQSSSVELVPLWKKPWRAPFHLYAAHHEKQAIHETGSGLSDTEYTRILILDFLLPELWEMDFYCLSYSICATFLYQSELRQTKKLMLITENTELAVHCVSSEFKTAEL